MVAEQELEKKAAKMLAEFARRAWRRPLSNEELRQLMSLYHDSKRQGFSFDGAIKSSLLLVLASPHFLYHGPVVSDQASSRIGNTKTDELSSLDLASRLSFFLWSSIPDEELLDLALQDRLRDSGVMRAQARRMLKDPRAISLAIDFAGQVWGFDSFEDFSGPDANRFPEFTPLLRDAMLGEVVHFLDDLLRHDRPLTALIDSNYTFADSTLAKHYGLKSAPSRMEQIELPAERGGLAGMGLFLTKTSLPLRTSPVQRGVWVAEQFLGRKIPPPPANVGTISEDEKSPEGLSIRDQLALHRSESNCAGCHARFDALGIALEQFDPIGRWRETDLTGEVIISSETTHDGIPLNGIVGLKQYLADHQEEVFRHFCRKLLGYALGRAVLPGDTALLERLQAELPQHEYRLSFLVENILSSPQFMTRRSTSRQNVP